MSFLDYLQDRRGHLLDLGIDHALIVIEAIVIAAAIGVALGLLTYRTDRPREIVLAVVGIFLTVPSLALFGLFIKAPDPFGLSRTSVVTALVMYSLLPIVRNTIVGLREVDPAVVESAEGMGMGRLRAPVPHRAAAGVARDHHGNPRLHGDRRGHRRHRRLHPRPRSG